LEAWTEVVERVQVEGEFEESWSRQTWLTEVGWREFELRACTEPGPGIMTFSLILCKATYVLQLRRHLEFSSSPEHTRNETEERSQLP
jgi:hypothetical protein